MAINAKNSRVLINEDHVSGSIKGWSVAHQREYGDATSVLDDGWRGVPGLLSGSMTLNGLFDSAVGGLYEEVAALVGVDNSALVTVLPDGFTIGKPALMTVSDIEGFEIPATVNELVSLTVNATADDGVDMGTSLHALTAETANGNGTSVDNTASSANGGVGALHLSAYSGFTNIVVKVQHSTDNSVWADLITFTTNTAVGSERKTVTGTVNRYVRALWTVTGAGSATFVVAFARR
ncbi:hypothetical protein V6U81_04400 [Micromonospora sp. CPCC 205711]|uniref:hypothetical protein n=1 Tax=Micromonospora sp. CPCC 205547 TaxID=3122400 RepID=UPI002FF0C72A